MIDENQRNIMPFYLLVDESGSMSGSPVDAVNEGLMTIWREVIKEPLVSKMVWVSVIAFSDHAEVLLPLTDLNEITAMPGCSTKGATNFGNAFRKMKQVIDSDVMDLKAQGMKVIRPVVFFMSDGEPTDAGWQQAHAELTDPGYGFRPHIMSFGIGSADGRTIYDVATDPGQGVQRQAYLALDGFAPEKVIFEIIDLFIATIIGKRSDGSMTHVMSDDLDRVLSESEPTLSRVTSSVPKLLKALPLYLVVEMTEKTQAITLIEIEKLKNALEKSEASDKIWLSVIAFAARAEVLLPLSNDLRVVSRSKTSPRGEANFGETFRIIRHTINEDIAKLKSDGYGVFRPIVLFISEGRPQDQDWQLDHASLVEKSNPYRPHIISFGIGSADPKVTHEVATVIGTEDLKQSYLLTEGKTVASVLMELVDVLISEII